ncbi:YheC/YheD family endospore coat-associated protein [Peribacillus deserti]|uniref:ATP-grasp domain-containing protein n=1 Tax=Peribacillus deserti TaxID=673318 RepID=A0A2N5M0A1_9BACI|nr:YheC/YheD family protein [Peribacillus deserti]PLT27794.1 hypothetical protein CUU66_22035 [Peribacillus deserti]
MKVKWINRKYDKVFINESLAEKLNMPLLNYITIHFGSWKRTVQVIYDKYVPEDTIEIAENIREEVCIPTELPYDAFFTNGNFYIGPVIAISIKKTKRRLTKKVLRNELIRLKNYQDIRGLVFLCSVEGIDDKEKRIEGYYFIPGEGGGKGTFKEGLFPYPNAFFNRSGLRKGVYNELFSTIGDKIFNSYYFNKLELWNWVKDNQELKRYFPDTVEAKSQADLVKMIEKHNTIYLKPASGSLGQGISKISKDKNFFVIQSHQNSSPLSLSNKRFEEWLANKFTKRYIAQQGIELLFDSHKVDFRVYFQKNKEMTWEMTGYIARHSKKGKITTNTQNLNNIEEGRKALIRIFNLDSSEAGAVEEKIKQICTDVCSFLDNRGGHYADVAFDMIIDQDLKIWILEINKRYLAKTLKSFSDRTLLRKVKTIPIEYAKAISGFYN